LKEAYDDWQDQPDSQVNAYCEARLGQRVPVVR